LDWLSPEVLKAGLNVWAAGFRLAKDDLTKDDYPTLAAFLVGLAIATGGDDAEFIFQKLFSFIHDRLMGSYLPWKASDILESCLPDLGWRRNWDLGLRFRLAVAQAYVRFQLDPQSFAALSDDPIVNDLLRDVASDLEGGQPYTHSLGGFRL
jgi:hypothetical protein